MLPGIRQNLLDLPARVSVGRYGVMVAHCRHLSTRRWKTTPRVRGWGRRQLAEPGELVVDEVGEEAS
jgi:hypothetical protein